MTPENDIEKLIKQFYAGKAVQSRPENDRQILADALTAFEQAKCDNKTSRLGMLIKIAAVIVVFLSVAFMFHFRAGNSSDLARAAIAKIRNADTLTYYVRTNDTTSPTKWTFTKSGYAQIYTDDLIIMLNADSAKGAVVMPRQKKTFAIELPNIQTENSQIPFLIIKKLQLFASQKTESLGKKEINNTTAQGFCLTDNDCVTTIWIDAESLLPVRFEMRFVNQSSNIVADGFKIDSAVEKPYIADYEKMPIRLNAEPWMANEFYLNEFIVSLTKLKNENDVFQASDTSDSFTGTAIRLLRKNNFIVFANCELEFVRQ